MKSHAPALLLVLALVSAAAAPEREPTLVSVRASRLSRGLQTATIDLHATVAHVRSGDSLQFTVVSFARCADGTATRTDAETHVFDRAAAESTVATQLAIPKAERYEVSFELAATGAEFEHTRTRSAFTTIREEACR